MKTIFMFSGQGSQYYHMASKLMETEPVFKKEMETLDQIAKLVSGSSILEKLYNEKCKLFDPFLTLSVSHPAIFMTGYAVAKMLEHYSIKPNYVLGSSLGEFTAAAVSGIIRAEDALRMIIRQAKTIEQTCAQGSMIAVLDELSVYHRHTSINSNCSIASINAPSQFVVAGARDQLMLVKKFMKENEILHQELMVSFGFHSASVDNAANDYNTYLESMTTAKPQVPFISGIYGKQLDSISSRYFWETVRKPALFSDGVKYIEREIGGKEDLVFIDLGTGALANLVKYNVERPTETKTFQIVTPFQQEVKKLEELKKYFAKRVVTPSVNILSGKKNFTAYVFPGQGSQKKGMGEGLFERYAELTDKASNILGYSIQELCLENPGRNLSMTQYTQPALYVVNALSYLQLTDGSRVAPDFVAGHSLGEFNALFAAGGFDFETGLKLVQRRGALMAQMQEGGMAAVKGLSEEEIKSVIARNGLTDLDVANYNTQNQIVLSGPRALIGASGHFFETAGASLYFPLNVNGAFHSRYMIPAKQEFERFLNQFTFSSLRIPVVSNVEARFYDNTKITTLLANQLTSPVRWTDSIKFLMEKGDVTFTEVGPGDVLTKLVWRIQQDLLEVV